MNGSDKPLLPVFAGEFRFLKLKELAEIFSLTPRELSRLVGEGLPTAGNVGRETRFDLVQAAGWYVRHLRTQLESVRNSPTLKEARQRKVELEIERDALRLARERGELAPVALLERQCSRMTSVLREQMLALPRRVAAELDLSPASVTRLRSEIETLLTQLSGGASPAPSLLDLMHGGNGEPSEK